jgi:metal-responsive CopG/Arc/MetJ family transcriptional regulator
VTGINHSRIHLRLPEEEILELDEATAESGAFYRSLFVTNALPNDLPNIDVSKIPQKRKMGIYVRIPVEKKKLIEQIAETYNLTQQAVVRYYIAQAAEAYRRKRVEQQNPTNEEQLNQ